MKTHLLIAALMLNFLAGHAVAADNSSAADIRESVSDAQAAREANESRRLAKQLWKKVDQACLVADEFTRNKALFSTQRRVNNMLRRMPTDHLKYRSRFVYSGCQEMLLDVSSHAGTCMSQKLRNSGYTQSYDARHWKLDSAQCDQEIAHPDLSLKDAQ